MKTLKRDLYVSTVNISDPVFKTVPPSRRFPILVFISDDPPGQEVPFGYKEKWFANQSFAFVAQTP